MKNQKSYTKELVATVENGVRVRGGFLFADGGVIGLPVMVIFTNGEVAFGTSVEDAIERINVV